MEYTEIIYLMRRSVELDDIGNNISSNFETRFKCYAKKQSVRTNEFYNATQIWFSLLTWYAKYCFSYWFYFNHFLFAKHSNSYLLIISISKGGVSRSVIS